MIIGLTGQTGAGKSTAAALLAMRGFHIIDADKIGHKITDSPEILTKIKAAFGGGIINSDGTLNRRRLGQIVFADREKLLLLNSITHPAIAAKITAEAQSHGSAVIDCALLGELKLDKICDFVLNITAPAELRLERIMARDGLSREAAANRINSQVPYEGTCTEICNSLGTAELEARLDGALSQREASKNKA